MKHFVASVDASLRQGNNIAALMTALAIPDICGALQEPSDQVGERYRSWWNLYCREKYTVRGEVWVSGDDIYALRNAMLHGGDHEKMRDGRNRVKKFQIIAPRGGTYHLNQTAGGMQLQLDCLCRDICDGATEWFADVAEFDDILERYHDLPEFK